MKVIGHRGAAGLALENTKEAILLAKKYKVDAIELDVRLTKDNQLVVVHDAHLGRIANKNILVRRRSLAELRRVRLTNGEKLLTLKDVFAMRARTLVIIEIKENRSAEVLLPQLKKEKNLIVISDKYHELRVIRKARPDIPIYFIARIKPVEGIHIADFIEADGLAINHWVLNPFVYRLARRKRLDIFVYTVKYRPVVWFLRKFYPHISICTDYPDRFPVTKRERELTKANLSAKPRKKAPAIPSR